MMRDPYRNGLRAANRALMSDERKRKSLIGRMRKKIMTTFNALLRRNGIDPAEVSLLRHKAAAAHLKIADFDRYQSTQEAAQPVFRRPRYWASFVAPTGTQTRFVGLYSVTLEPDVTVDWPDPLTGHAVGAEKPGKPYEVFRTVLAPVMSEYIDRLFVAWDRSERSWAQHAKNNDKLIVAGVDPDDRRGPASGIPDSLDEMVATTTRETHGDVRIGQAVFRARLLDIWQGRCALTGLALPGLLRASHIKPWRFSSDAERLDPANGLLLAVHVDALFDAHLISFDGDGTLVRSEYVSVADLAALGIPESARLQGLHPRTISYLRHHRSRMTRR